MKEVFKDTKYILKMISKMSKSLLPLSVVTNMLKSLIPFVNIYFSYLILDGFEKSFGKSIILKYVYEMAAINLVLGITVSFLIRVLNVKSQHVFSIMNGKVAGKSLTMDYEQLEKKQNMEMLKRAEDGANSNGGIQVMCDHIGALIGNTASVIYSIILVWPLFLTKQKQSAGFGEKIITSPYTSVLMFALIIAALAVNFKIMDKINKRQYSYFEKNVDSNRKFSYFYKLTEDYKIGKDIRLYNMSDMITSKGAQYSTVSCDSMIDLGKMIGKYGGYTYVINQILSLCVYIFVGIKALYGLVSIGDIIKYVSSIMQFFYALSEGMSRYNQLNLQRQYIKNYCNYLDIENTKYDGTLPIEKRNDDEYDLEFKNVSFHYPNSRDMILKNISFKIKVGRKLAIVGRNGAGKTTFIKLLCRLYDPTDGQILLNGIDIRKYDYKEYMDLFSVVFQDFKLFSFDIGQNVAASVDYDEAKVWDVLEKAGIKDRVKKMDKGLQTYIYKEQENGVEISGGEAQKLAIARALYKDSPLVILDEPTSALDPLSEYEIYKRFDELVNEKTSIYISHRMSSCRFCDNILVFDKGKIIQNGSHDKLVRNQDGLYYKLWSAQAKYYA